jgi:hypothetical protein
MHNVPVIATPEALSVPATELAHALVCASCGHAITRDEARVVRGGSHLHTRLNPHGYVWEFGCFADAPGCVVVGPATLEHTWFPDHAWRFAHCGRCGGHLGWRYDGPSSFFGLITERLAAT